MRFRAADAGSSLISAPLTSESVRALLQDVIAPRHFFLGPVTRLELQHLPAEERFWEIFQGRLLDPAHTRKKATFESWNVHLVQDDARSAEPLLSLKLDAVNGMVHVVRGLDVYAWEGYDAGGGVILSRERRRWTSELSTTIQLDRLADQEELRDELMCGLFHAAVGTSRLPLSSDEAPLPAFSFGELFYCYCPGDQPPLLEVPIDRLNPIERVKWLEMVLHRLPLDDLDRTEDVLWQRGADWLALFRQMFNEISLSPWTGLVERALALVDAWRRRERLAPAALIDFHCSLLCLIGRHLTAYDLTTFHYRGSNYPDALLLDAVLKQLLGLAEQHPHLLAGQDREGRLRRRGLRQGWLLRRFYEGHAVPDAPTSPGENQRVLPASHPRVPEEQITQPARRKKHLFAGDALGERAGPAVAELLRQSMRDLEHEDELRELGMAVFLDRPLGDAKANAEPDRTPLLSSLAYSRTIAQQRLQALRREHLLQAEGTVLDVCMERLQNGPPCAGVPVDQIGPARRAAAVSLSDARRVAPDFVFLRTTAGSLADLLGQLDLRLDWQGGLVARAATGASVLLYDRQHRPRLELVVDASRGYAVRANREYPRAGVRVTRI